MRVFSTPDELREHVGQPLEPSPWTLVDQARIDRFADATDDHQWIHVDPERAAEGPFGGTIAHGFLTLSLLPSLNWRVFRCDFATSTINYGLDKVRFLTPVPSGAEVRTVPTIASVEETSSGLRAVVSQQVEVRHASLDGTKLAAVVDSVTLYVTAAEGR